MEFERIGKNTVQCHMTVEEMNEYGLRIEDFFTNQEKSRNFLEQLVERAEEEIGYEVESGMISMQLMRLPDDSLVITFSDRGEEGIHNMLNQIQNMAGMIDEESAETIADALAKESGATLEDGIAGKESMEEFQKRLKRRANQAIQEIREQRRKERTTAKVYAFDTLSPLEDFARTLDLEKSIPSKLYKDSRTGTWYLQIKKGKLKAEEYRAIYRRLQEYGVLQEERPYIEQYCKEHYELILGKHALRNIKEYLS